MGPSRIPRNKILEWSVLRTKTEEAAKSQVGQSRRREKEEKLKKDIIAAITFLVTGILFFAVQSDGKTGELFPQGIECDIHEAVLVGETTPDTEPSVILDSRITRDS